MRFLGILFPVLLVLCLALWAYKENSSTDAAAENVEGLKAEIARNQDLLKFLNDEWAYLNRPDRLKKLVELHFEELRLSPLTHSKFEHAGSLPLRSDSEPQLDRDSGLILAAPRIAYLQE